MPPFDKPIIFSHHALAQLTDRGATQEEVTQTIMEGEQQPAKKGRIAFQKHFPFAGTWKGRYYLSKQVMAIVAEEKQGYVVVTAYVFFHGGVS